MKRAWLIGLEVHFTRVKYFKRISLVSKIFNTKIFCAAREIFLNFFATKIYLPGSLLPTCGSKKETDTINLGISLLCWEYSHLIGPPVHVIPNTPIWLVSPVHVIRVFSSIAKIREFHYLIQDFTRGYL